MSLRHLFHVLSYQLCQLQSVDEAEDMKGRGLLTQAFLNKYN